MPSIAQPKPDRKFLFALFQFELIAVQAHGVAMPSCETRDAPPRSRLPRWRSFFRCAGLRNCARHSPITMGKKVKYRNTVNARLDCSLAPPVKGTTVMFRKNASVNNRHMSGGDHQLRRRRRPGEQLGRSNHAENGNGHQRDRRAAQARPHFCGRPVARSPLRSAAASVHDAQCPVSALDCPTRQTPFAIRQSPRRRRPRWPGECRRADTRACNCSPCIENRRHRRHHHGQPHCRHRERDKSGSGERASRSDR